MALIAPTGQSFNDVKQLGADVVIGVSNVTLVSASDTVTVPRLANTAANASSAQVRDAGEAAVTVTDDGVNTVTLVGTAGNKVTLITLHRNINLGLEA